MAYDKALVQKAATDTGVPQDLLERLIAEESSGDPKAVSYRGPSYGEGLTQLSEGTAHDVGVGDRFDAGQNIEGGAKYLAGLHREFGSWPLALAAYVSGPETVRKAGGIPDNPQVKRYVEKVTGQMSEAATAPTATGGPMNKAVESLVADEQAGLAAYDKASAKASGVNAELAQREADIGKQIEGIDGELDKLSAHRPAPPAEAKLPGYQPPAQKNPLQALTTVLPLMLLAGSKMGRNKGLALMKSASGMLAGVNAGNDETRKHYQEDFKAKLDEAIEQQKMDHDHYMDIMESLNTSGKDALAKLQVFAALSENDQLRAAALNGDFKAVADRMQMSGHVLTSLLEVQRNALTSEQNAIRNKQESERLAIEQQRADETHRYHEEQSPLKRMAAAEKLRNDVDKSPLGKAYANLDQYSHVIDNSAAKIDAGQKLGSQEQAAFLDAFTKIVTGGQAIRGFTLKLNTQHAGLADKAQVLAQQLGKGGPLSPRQEQEMIGVVREYTKALSDEYEGTIARADDFAKKAGVIGDGESVAPFEVDPSTLHDRSGGDGWSIKPVG